MDELSFIREQVRTERRHMGEVRAALDDALAAGGPGATDAAAVGSSDAFVAAAVRYLVFIVQRFNAQDQAHGAQLRPRLDAADSDARMALDELDATLARSRAEIAVLQEAMQAGASPALRVAARRYLDFYQRELLARRHSLTPWLERHYAAADWRRASMVDAESILEERDLYESVRSTLPAGIELRSRAGQRP